MVNFNPKTPNIPTNKCHGHRHILINPHQSVLFQLRSKRYRNLIRCVSVPSVIESKSLLGTSASSVSSKLSIDGCGTIPCLPLNLCSHDVSVFIFFLLPVAFPEDLFSEYASHNC